MRELPMEYTYIDEFGKLWYKTYGVKKTEVTNIDPYLLSGIPVVVNKNTTVETLCDVINKYELMKNNCIAFDTYYKELKSHTEETKEGQLSFCWDGITIDKQFANTLYPMMSVFAKINNKTYAIDLANTSSLRNLKVDLNVNFPIYNKDKTETTILWPTLFQLIYGLFWEFSFHGTPEKRDIIKEDLKKTAEDIKNNNAKLKVVEFNKFKQNFK